MTSLLLCSILGLVQAPSHHPAQAPTKAGRDTIYVAVPPSVTVQTPPSAVTVEPQSQTPSILLGIVGALLLLAQLRIMSRQTDAMNRQATISERQTDLSEEAARWRRDEAIGTFYRVAFDLVEEFKKANVAAPGTKIEANYQTYPRLMLREAARLFSPLGDLVTAMTEVAFFLEDYFSAVVDYNTSPRGVEGAGRWHRVQSAREKVGERLDNAESHIPPESRWEVAGEPDIRFAHRCAAPPAIAEAFGIETATPPPASRVDTPSGTRPASDDAPTT